MIKVVAFYTVLNTLVLIYSTLLFIYTWTISILNLLAASARGLWKIDINLDTSALPRLGL